jgi:hypothetical protein
VAELTPRPLVQSRSATALLVALLALFAAACGGGAEWVEFYGGEFRAWRPDSWSMLTGLNAEADLEMGNPRREAYCIVLTEGKADYAQVPTLAEFSETTRAKILAGLADATETGPQRLVFHGWPALRTTIEGVKGKVRVHYWHTVIESPDHLHQVLCWSLPSRFESNRWDFDKVLHSIRETL